jgi:hypothetical protein
MIQNLGPERVEMKKRFAEEQIVAILREGEWGSEDGGADLPGAFDQSADLSVERVARVSNATGSFRRPLLPRCAYTKC